VRTRAIAQIERLAEQSGGFGCYLLMAHEWANPEASRRSYELLARYVMPPPSEPRNRRSPCSSSRSDARPGTFGS